ncbi:Ca2+-binding RTX toxin-like protein [Haloferula luteola]|uniref:Ca2+-binding RTX toxin-like protein n=1 Tax=Haloferula luteola TaxID=595692 RepID=A0A840V5Z3_9BACT|nr:metallophosphoesterase [Haloferula luteola]MBB5350208.1 Ca2+-binding RTX toxin-like protein [Haloferula luteola]
MTSRSIHRGWARLAHHATRTCLTTLLLSTTLPSALSEEIRSFGVVFLPDTQFYSRYATEAEGDQFLNRYGSNPFEAQTAWLADNLRELEIPMVAHLGDIVDQVSLWPQWNHATIAMRTLDDAGISYSILAGNHDVLDQSSWDTGRNLSNEPFRTYFPLSRARQQSTFGGMDPRGFHQYHIFEFQGQRFLNLALSWNASLTALRWAQDIIDTHPELPVILTTHELLGVDSDGVTAKSTSYGDYLWENLIRKNDQIFMAIGGHHHGSAHRVRQNDEGHDVLEVVADYQMSYQGGNGYLRLCEFDLTHNEIRSMTFSPWVPTKPEATINEFDRAVLDDASNEYVTPMNFAERFAGFAGTLASGPANRDEPLIETVRKKILAEYEEPEAATPMTPFDSEDYPHNGDQTLAHWRFDSGQSGTTVATDTEIPDLSEQSNNPLVRSALTDGAELGDLLWSDERHALSAANGSVQFLGNTSAGWGKSFFKTLQEAPLNSEFLRNGYTVEAIFKIHADWTRGNNSWMNVMTRDGNRGNLSGWSGGDAESTPLLFSISNLREIQWEPTTYTSWGYQARTNWSGEIMPEVWTHVAIVNEPGSHNSTMYVAGAPVLRNVNGADGIAGFSQQSWVIGAGLWGSNRTDGFFGSISEIRVSKSALRSDQWLTARKNRIVGNGGRETLVGTDRDDQVFQNAAADTLSGGAGRDTFVYQSQRDGMDTIIDFEPMMDRINITRLLNDLGYAGDDPVGDGQIRFIDSTRGALVQIVNPSRPGTFRNLILLQGTSLGAIDPAFTLIY